MDETKSVTVDLANGTAGATLEISQFTDNFDTVKFSLNPDLKDFTFMIVTLADGRSQIIQSSPEKLFTETDDSGRTSLVWKLGKEVTSKSGMVVYQVVAYELLGEEIKSTWYSKEGRITVSPSVDTNLESAELIGSYPNLITRIILELESHRKDMEELENTKVSHRDGYGLSQNDFTDNDALKLNSVEDFAQQNVIEKIKIDGSVIEVDSNDKSVNIELKEKLDSKVDAEFGKGLSSNDFTDGNWFKLDNIEYEAQQNVIEKIKVDGEIQAVDETDKSVNIDISDKADKSELSEAAFSGKYTDLAGIPVTDLGDIDISLISLDEYFERITETGIYKFTVTGNGFAGVSVGNRYAFVTYFRDAIGNHVVSQIFLGDAYNIAGYRYGRKNTMSTEGDEFVWGTTQDFLTVDTISSNVTKGGIRPVSSKGIYSFVRPEPVKEIPDILLPNKSYNFSGVPSKLEFPSEAVDGDVIYLTFKTGEEVPDITFITTNTSDYELIPEADTGYEIFAKFNGSVWIVNYSEYKVTNS